MKAQIATQYGGPVVFEYREVEKPAPTDDAVLVKIHAASINSWDYDMLTGTPKIYRMIFGRKKCKYDILGFDIAGTVEAVGKNVSKFKVGDEVMGDLSESGWGAFAEYTCAKEVALVLKPEELTFEEAAAIPQGGVMAWLATNEYYKVKKNDQVLLVGAGGAVGTFATQLIKNAGAELTVVDTGNKLEKLKELGADYVVDYKTEDFAAQGKRYNLIIDVMAFRTVGDYAKSLKKGGKLFIVGGSIKLILKAMLWLPFLSVFSAKKMGILVHRANKGLDKLLAEIVQGKVKVITDKEFKLNELPEAFSYYKAETFFGKIVIKV